MGAQDKQCDSFINIFFPFVSLTGVPWSAGLENGFSLKTQPNTTRRQISSMKLISKLAPKMRKTKGN